MEGLWNMLAFLGAVVVGIGLFALILWIGAWSIRLRRVVRDYHETAPKPEDVRPWGESNLFQRIVNSSNETKNRLYVAERNASNAKYRIDSHVKDNKHTKTAKKIALDKERKKIAEEDNHDREIRGCGDGM
jgi:lipopolysaccharide export LptBFGC system permease protein LptF